MPRLILLAYLMLVGVMQLDAAQIEGMIYESGEALPNAVIALDGQTVTTDATGSFTLKDVSPGEYSLQIYHPDGKQSEQISITVSPNEPSRLTFDFSAHPPILSEVVVVTRREPPKPSQQTVLGSEIQRVAGTGNDVLRALQALPGIASANDLSGELFIRGGGPDDNVFYFDRTFLSYPYHFGGLVSTLSSELIGQVDVYAGGFGAEFGANAQAIIDIQAREANREKLTFTSNINLLMSELFIESPLGSKASFYLAGRRSYADLIVPHIIEIEQLTAFPRFWDYQMGFDYELTSNQRLSFNAFGAQDFMEFLLKDENVTEQPELAGNFHYRSGFIGQGLTLKSLFGESSSLKSTFSHTGYLIDLSFGQGYFLRARPDFYSLREDMEVAVHPKHTLQLGTELATGIVALSAFFTRPPDEGKPDYDFGSEPKITTDTEDRFTYAEAYWQDRITLTSWLSLSIGARLNYFNLTDALRLDPRVSFSLQIPGGANLRAAWGEYHQSPQGSQILPDWGNPDVYESKATHYVLEVEREVLKNTSLKVAGYYKDLQDLITADREAIYLNQGTGFARGVELLLKHKPSERFFGWLSYAYSLSRRQDRPGAEERLYSYDQTHVMTLIMSYRPTPKWELGLKWHYSTGTPFTPVVDAQPIDRADGKTLYLPVYGEVNSRRLPPFHRFDLRFVRRFSFLGADMESYLEILNTYYRKNVLAIDYNEDYSEEKRLYQLPIVPYIGLSAKF